MNSTFMFGEDRFGSKQDYSIAYQELGGRLPKQIANQWLNASFAYLAKQYPNYHKPFPSVPDALRAVANNLPEREIELLTQTFAAHERGYLPTDYAAALQQLSQSFRLGAVIDIWSPKDSWLSYLKQQQVLNLFEVLSFSSDHGYVKPSPYGFQLVLKTMQLAPQEVVFIGDSVRRDLAGANATGIDCILVGGATSPQAIASFANLLSFCEFVFASNPPDILLSAADE
ncbi:HAD family hydrolase [uncultured Thiothrix sp.]|uniref:HAD family hydrolase n=1 Tax=uncultured Thiothrix sp. TaxID=223185 RepID=UPI0026316B0B|nr:HAD-IA family hydrolase [uncultured Thiothrix sp.]